MFTILSKSEILELSIRIEQINQEIEYTDDENRLLFLRDELVEIIKTLKKSKEQIILKKQGFFFSPFSGNC